MPRPFAVTATSSLLVLLCSALPSQQARIGAITSGETGSLLNIGVSVGSSAPCFPDGSLALLLMSLTPGQPGFCFQTGPAACDNTCVPIGVDLGASIIYLMPDQALALGSGNSLAWRFDYLGSLLLPYSLSLPLYAQAAILSPTGAVTATDTLSLNLSPPSGNPELAHCASFAPDLMRLHRIDTGTGTVTDIGDFATGSSNIAPGSHGRPESSDDGRFIAATFENSSQQLRNVLVVDTSVTPATSTFFPVAANEVLMAPPHFCPGTSVLCAPLRTETTSVPACGGGSQWFFRIGMFDASTGTRLPDFIAAASCSISGVTVIEEWGFTGNGGHVFFLNQDAWAPIMRAQVSVVGGAPQFGALTSTLLGPNPSSYFVSKAVIVPCSDRVACTTDSGAGLYLHLVDVATGAVASSLMTPTWIACDAAPDGSSIVFHYNTDQWMIVDPNAPLVGPIQGLPLTGFNEPSTHVAALPGGHAMLVASVGGVMHRVDWDASGNASVRSVSTIQPGGLASVYWTQSANLNESVTVTSQSGLWLPRQGVVLAGFLPFTMVEPVTVTWGAMVPNTNPASGVVNPAVLVTPLSSGRTLFH